MNETPLFFSNQDEQLFGVLHRPEGLNKKLGWVFCHGFGEEKLWSHRVFVSFARGLSSRGYNVLRFDYRGYGDSDGLFVDSTPKSQLSDIQKAIEILQENCDEVESVGLVGLRYGAVLASLAAEETDICEHLVLWEPLTDMERYLKEILRINLTAQLVLYGEVRFDRDTLVQEIMQGGTINVDGYELSRELYKPACEINLLGRRKKFSGSCQVVQIGRKSQPPKKDILALCNLYPDCDFRQVVEEQFWKEIRSFVQRSDPLNQAAFDWLESL